MPTFNADVKEVKAAISVSVDTAANWGSKSYVLPAGIWMLESDTMKIKISDGTKNYSALPYVFESLFTDAYKQMLDKANTANGVVTLGGDGKIDVSLLPDSITSAVGGIVVYVANISERDLLPAEKKTGLVVVVDASADPTVTSGMASYVWKKDDGDGDGGTWLKVSENESLDIDLSNYFNKTSDNLDSIQDGTTYIKMEKTWKTSVDDLLTHALRDDYSYYLVGPNASEYEAMQSEE